MARDYLRSLLLAELCGFWAFSATAATSLFSNYGQIQNVQNYSTNPFWSPNSPYNQRLPQPVYAQGADLNAGDCISVVQSMVSAQCMSRNNCKNTDLSEIRPAIMVQLANLPGHNYVSACSGYLDNVFETYKTQNKNGVSNRSVSFPGSTTQNPNANGYDGIQLKNPYKQQPTKWQIGIKSRADELQELQNENGANDYGLSAQKFPTTYEDLSFTKRWENEREGIMPYKDLNPYEVPDIKGIDEWCSGEHESSIACMNYLCAEGGKKASERNCISYRCSKPEYYSSHEEECKRNKLCVPDNNSEQCMRYRCYETADKDFEECIEWKCNHDHTFSENNPDLCLKYTCGEFNASDFIHKSDDCKTMWCGDPVANPFHSESYTNEEVCKDWLCTYTEYESEHLDQCCDIDNLGSATEQCQEYLCTGSSPKFPNDERCCIISGYENTHPSVCPNEQKYRIQVMLKDSSDNNLRPYAANSSDCLKQCSDPISSGDTLNQILGTIVNPLPAAVCVNKDNHGILESIDGSAYWKGNKTLLLTEAEAQKLLSTQANQGNCVQNTTGLGQQVLRNLYELIPGIVRSRLSQSLGITITIDVVLEVVDNNTNVKKGEVTLFEHTYDFLP